MNKIGKALLALPLSLALISCGKEITTKKETTTVKPTTTINTVSTTRRQTTEVKTTTAKKEDTSLKYRVSKEIYDSYFNPTIDQFLALNLTINEKSSYEGMEEINDVYRYQDGKIHFIDEVHGDRITIFEKEEVSLSYKVYTQSLDSWIQTDSESISEHNLIFYLYGVAFDYEKLTFDLNENVYKSDEVVRFDSASDGYEYSNCVLKFEDNKPVSFSFDVKQIVNFDETDIIEGNVNYTFSKVGTTKVVSPEDQKYAVEQELFDSYFNITNVDDLFKLNYSLDYSSMSDLVGVSGTHVINHDTCLINKYTYYEMAMGQYDDRVDFVSYHYDKNSKVITNESAFYNTLRGTVTGEFKLDFFNFDEFNFNSETKAYECAELIVDGNTKYTDIKIYFEDNVIKKYTFIEDYRGTVSNVTKSFSNVGTTTIEINNTSKIDEETFNKYFNITNLSDYANLNCTISCLSITDGEIESINNIYVSNGAYIKNNTYVEYELNADNETFTTRIYSYDKADDSVSLFREFDRVTKEDLNVNLKFIQCKYRDFRYDANNDKYTAGEIVISDTVKYRDVEIVFNNGKLVSLTYKIGNTVYCCNYSNFGTTTINVVKE